MSSITGFENSYVKSNTTSQLLAVQGRNVHTVCIRRSGPPRASIRIRPFLRSSVSRPRIVSRKISTRHCHIGNEQVVVAAFPARHNDMLLTMWDEFRIALDIGDEIEHLLRAVVHATLGMDDRHLSISINAI